MNRGRLSYGLNDAHTGVLKVRMHMAVHASRWRVLAQPQLHCTLSTARTVHKLHGHHPVTGAPQVHRRHLRRTEAQVKR